MIEPPRIGQPITAEYIGRIVNEVNRNRLAGVGPGLEFRRGPAGTMISLSQAMRAEGGTAAPYPWKVRYHEPAAEAGGTPPDPQWEVYLPPGTLTVGSACYVMNEPAGATSGHADEEGWYLLPLSENMGSGTHSYQIVAHGKRIVRMNSGGGQYSVARPFVMVAAEELPAAGSSAHSPLEDPTLRKMYAGDVWSSVIARVSIGVRSVGGETITTREARNSIKAAVNVQVPPVSSFEPSFDLAYDSSNPQEPLAVDEFNLSRRMFYVGGVGVEAEDADLQGNDVAGIFVEIDTTAETPTISLLRVGEGDSEPESSTGIQYVRIFDVLGNYISADLRDNLRNQVYYRGLT